MVAEVLKSHQDLSARIKGLEREGSVISKRETTYDINDDASTITQRRVSTNKRSSFRDFGDDTAKSAFEQVLKASRVYNKAGNRHSLSSATSTALYTTALSVFSSLSLSQISNISFYALPVYAVDLAASQYYIFGEEGAENAVGGNKEDIPDSASASTIKAESSLKKVSYQPRIAPAPRKRLLGRFALNRKIKISDPQNPTHLTNVRYDLETGHFTVGELHKADPTC